MDTALELLAPGETALCLFTHGQFFCHYANGTGSSGLWVLREPRRPFNRIIIYKWTHRDGQRHVDVFTALPTNISDPEGGGVFGGRYTVHFHELRLAGTTTASWENFVGTPEHPVTYITGNHAN